MGVAISFHNQAEPWKTNPNIQLFQAKPIAYERYLLDE
jgi:hypothetical protein